MRKILIFIWLINLPFALFSREVNFSDSLEFSVLTVSPGTELYSVFGHSAIRLVDNKNGYDFVFNYGTFDFQTRGFYFKFALGRLDYRLSVESFDDFIQMCQYENRTVVAQQLNLSLEQKRSLLLALLENYKPKNRYYRYKFFTDNCATRVRDILSQHLSGMQWRGLAQVGAQETFRQLYRPYLQHMPWTLVGIELLMGPMADRPSGYDVMFLPNKLMQALALARLNNSELVAKEKILFKAISSPSSATLFSPLLLSIVLIVLAILVQFHHQSKQIFDNLLFTVLGGLGGFILVLSLVSAHRELHFNTAALLFFPLLVIWPWIKNETFRRSLLIGAVTIVAIVLLITLFLPQHFSLPIYLLVLTLIIRLLGNIWDVCRGKAN